MTVLLVLILVFWVAVGFFADASKCGETFLDTGVTHATGVQRAVKVAAYPAVAMWMCFFGFGDVIVVGCFVLLLLSLCIGFAFLVFTFAFGL